MPVWKIDFSYYCLLNIVSFLSTIMFLKAIQHHPYYICAFFSSILQNFSHIPVWRNIFSCLHLKPDRNQSKLTVWNGITYHQKNDCSTIWLLSWKIRDFSTIVQEPIRIRGLLLSMHVGIFSQTCGLIGRQDRLQPMFLHFFFLLLGMKR